jgi:hypothetical protein
MRGYEVSSSGSGQGLVAGSGEPGNKQSGFIEREEFVYQLRDY